MDVLGEQQPKPPLAMKLGANDEGVAAGERGLEVGLYAGYDQIDAALGKLTKADAHAAKHFVAGMLQVVEVGRVVDNMAHVAFVVADLELDVEGADLSVEHDQLS